MLTTTALVLAMSLISAEEPITPKDNQCLVELSVPGMSCPMGCSPVVTRALKSVKGVETVRVKFKDKLARVIANAPICNAKGTATMVKAVEDAGYQCKPVTKDQAAPKS